MHSERTSRTTEVFRTRGPEETEALGSRISRGLSAGDVVGLVGELGSGKTCFVRGMAEGLGIGECIKSPSFTIINIYEGGRLVLYHIDLYRIEGEAEVGDIGLEEYIYGEGLSVIEWADRVPDVLRECTVVARFFHEGGDERRVEIERRDAV